MEARKEREQQFGNGEYGGDRHWSAPVHGVTEDGEDITASFGYGGRSDQTLAARGHVGMSEFYEYQDDGEKGHDHFGPNGEPYNDRGRTN